MFQQYLSSNKRWSWSTLCCQKKSHVISQSMKWVRKLESSQFSLLRLNLGPSLMFLRMTRFVISVTWWVSLNAWSVLCAVDSCGRWIQQSVSYLSWMNSLSGCWKLNVQIWLVWRDLELLVWSTFECSRRSVVHLLFSLSLFVFVADVMFECTSAKTVHGHKTRLHHCFITKKVLTCLFRLHYEHTTLHNLCLLLCDLCSILFSTSFIFQTPNPIYLRT